MLPYEGRQIEDKAGSIMAKAIDKKLVTAVLTDVRAALEVVAKKHGLGVVQRKSAYDMIIPKFELHLLDKKAGAGIEQQLFERSAELLGLEKADFGKTFVASGKQYTISGMAPNPFRKSKPVIATRADGKRYVFGVESVNQFLGR